MMQKNWTIEFLIHPTYSVAVYDWAQIAEESRNLINTLKNVSKAHYEALIGVQSGENAHAHIALASPDLRADRKRRAGRWLNSYYRQKKEGWSFGRIQADDYDLSKGDAGVLYTKRHRIVSVPQEIFCPKQGKCRERCIYCGHNDESSVFR